MRQDLGISPTTSEPVTLRFSSCMETSANLCFGNALMESVPIYRQMRTSPHIHRLEFLMWSYALLSVTTNSIKTSNHELQDWTRCTFRFGCVMQTLVIEYATRVQEDRDSSSGKVNSDQEGAS